MAEREGAARPQGFAERDAAWGVYIHIPFCRTKCLYCDFPSYAGRDALASDYVGALIREIETAGALAVEQRGMPATIYIGGGTPSVLAPALMERLLAAVQKIFCEADFPHGQAALRHAQGSEPEFTIECNPGTVTLDALKSFRLHGANRLSFGVQSFDDKMLRRLGRIHTGLDAMRSLHLARIAGFSNISMDLMYGLPSQRVDDFSRDLQAMAELSPEHVSVYGLQVEPGTPFHRMQEEGRLALPSEAEAEAMYDLMTAFLPARGYARYEISSFARAGFASQHNLGYWRDRAYLGLGAAAHSYLAGERLENTHDIEAYIAAIAEGRGVRRLEEVVTEQAHMEEFAFLALRTTEGISLARFEKAFGRTLGSVYAAPIADLKEKGLLEEVSGFVRLTKAGMKRGNLAFEAFLLG